MSTSTGLSPLARGFARLFDLEPEELEQLQALEAESTEVPARRTIVEEGKQYDYALIVQSGWLVEQKYLRSGKRQVLNFRLPGEIAAIDSLGYAAMPHSVAALSASMISKVPLELFERMLREHPRLGSAIFLMTLREEAILHQWEVSLGRRNGVGRLAHLLLELHRRVYLRGLADHDGFCLPATQEDLADALGLTTSYVNRVLQGLRRDGLISLQDRKLVLLDGKSLARQAGFRADYLENWGAGQKIALKRRT